LHIAHCEGADALSETIQINRDAVPELNGGVIGNLLGAVEGQDRVISQRQRAGQRGSRSLAQPEVHWTLRGENAEYVHSALKCISVRSVDLERAAGKPVQEYVPHSGNGSRQFHPTVVPWVKERTWVPRAKVQIMTVQIKPGLAQKGGCSERCSAFGW